MNSFTEISGSLSKLEKSEIVVLPVPYDGTSTWRKGADKGPFAILDASQALELYDIETDYEVYKKGIHTCSMLEVSSLVEGVVGQVKAKVRKLLSLDKFVVTLGGEHSISVGAVKAYREKYKDLCVLQLDAHADLRDEYMGSRYNHACTAARIKEICPIVQAGIRSMSVEESSILDLERVIMFDDIQRGNNWMDRMTEMLSDRVYVTIDLDVLDSAIMPSTGTPEPGGFDWRQITGLLKAISEKKNVVGFDVVELCPSKDNKAPDFTAAKLIYKFLSYIYSRR